MRSSQESWRESVARKTRRAVKKQGEVWTVAKVMNVTRAAKNVIEMAPTPALIHHARASAGLDQWDVFTALRVPGATWRAWERGEASMPAAAWARFQTWLKERAACRS